MKAFSFRKRKPFGEKGNNMSKKVNEGTGRSAKNESSLRPQRTQRVLCRETIGFYSLKGISPLVAAVILIAITMAIAGLMAAFATNITTSKLSEAKRCTPPTITMLDL